MSSPTSSSQFRAQWSEPGDILSVLLLIGGDVIRSALAQLAGSVFTPVTFSFGWVAYSFSSLMFVVGGGKLMPESDYPCLVINAKEGYVRSNHSWILGRVLRDFDHWKPREVSDKLHDILADAERADLEAANARPGIPNLIPIRRERAGLCVSIFRTSTTKQAGRPANDWVFYSGICTALIQFGVAAIPCGLYLQWSVLMITTCGTLLSFASGALPQWKAEKWQCRRRAKTVILTEGNGAQHALVIIGHKEALDLEDLTTAAGARNMLPFTRLCTGLLAFLWIALLISVSGLKQNTWFLLIVGGIGMIQNVVVAGAPRKPQSFGLHLELENVIGHRKAMIALMEVEEKYPGVGANLVPTFFPGKLREDEEKFWNRKEKERAEQRSANIAMPTPTLYGSILPNGKT